MSGKITCISQQLEKRKVESIALSVWQSEISWFHFVVFLQSVKVIFVSYGLDLLYKGLTAPQTAPES